MDEIDKWIERMTYEVNSYGWGFLFGGLVGSVFTILGINYSLVFKVWVGLGVHSLLTIAFLSLSGYGIYLIIQAKKNYKKNKEIP